MLQEKASAVADEGVTVAQSSELATDSSHLGLPVAPSIHHNNEVDQVKRCLMVWHSLDCLDTEKSDIILIRVSKTTKVSILSFFMNLVIE